MRLRTKLGLLVVLLGVFTALGLAWITLVRDETPLILLPPKPSEEARRDEELVTVLVARTRMPYGARLRQPQYWFETKAIPRRCVTEHAVTQFDQLQDRILAKDIAKGEAVDAAHLLKMVGIPLDEGRRAMGIKVIYPADWPDWFQPGSVVCVEQTLTKDTTGKETKQIILENVLLLSTDGLTVDQDEALEKGTLSATVVLAVTPEEAQVLTRAQQVGGTLRLRNANGK